MKRAPLIALFCTVSLLLSSCVHQRILLPEQASFADSFVWYASPNPNGSNSVSFMLGGKLVYVDPVFEDSLYPELPKADLILVTHTHLDHYSIPTMKALSVPGTVIAGHARLKQEIPGSVPMTTAETRELAGLTVTTYPAYNSSHHRISGGLAFTVSDGYRTVFISGDTDFQKEFIGIKNIDVALYFMSPPLTLSVADAMKLTRAIRPAVIIPVHWIAGMEDMTEELAKKTGSRSSVRVLERMGEK